MQGIWISEKILQKQSCTVCKKYLSHGPIKITTKEGVKCGRCSTESDIGAISCVNSVFERVIFPCVNRYEGCSHLLKFQDVPKHEETCIGKQYSCPLCPEKQYGSNSLLCLLNHYRHFHKSAIISEPSIMIDMEVRQEHTYLYCNDLEMEDGSQKYYSPGEVCGVYGVNLNAHEVDLETLLLKNCTTSLHCIFDFDIFTALRVISNTKNTKNNAICIESYGHSHNNNCPTVNKRQPKPYYSRYRRPCNLCENYFARSGNTEIYTCSSKSICGICFHNGISDCHINCNIGQEMYSCRYQCQQNFKVSELIIHEKQCLLNTEGHLDDEAFGMLHFGNYFCINSDDTKFLLVRSNLVTYNLDAFGSKGRIYMVTEYFKCILFYETDKSYIWFRAAHQYSPYQYCIKFKVVKHGVLPTEEVTSFYIDFVENTNFFFCVFLRNTVI